VTAKEIIHDTEAFHYNALPIGTIETVTVLAKDRLHPKTKPVPKKFVRIRMHNFRIFSGNNQEHNPRRLRDSKQASRDYI